MKTLRLLLSLPLALAGGLSLHAADAGANPAPPSSLPKESLSHLLDQAGSQIESGGLVAAEADPGAVRYFSAGHPAPRADIPPEKVIFEIGSITKVFTSLLLAQAVVEHKVALGDPIGRYLPASVTMDPATAAITLEQLATHTSGLPRMPDNFHPKNQLNPYADYAIGDLYAFLRDYRSPASPPHPGVYSNLGAGLLGHVLELVYQQPYADLIAAKISRPLGLPDTAVDLDEEQQSRSAAPHSGHLAIEALRQQALAGAGALHSTAADLVRFAQLLMSPDQNPLRAAWEIARQPRFAMGPGKIGLNVMIVERGGQVVYWHNGATSGSRSYLEWSPQAARQVLVILANSSDANPDSLAAALSKPKSTRPSPTPERTEMPLPAGKTADYVGIYALSGKARFTFVTDASGQLQCRLTGQGFGLIFFAGGDRFFARAVQAEFQFGRAPDGRVDRVTLFQNGHEMKAKRTDDPVPTVLFLSPVKLKEYAGRYPLGPKIEFEAKIKGGWLFVQLTGQPAFPVYCDQPDHFVFEVVPAALTFERDQRGAVTALVLHQNGRDQRAEKLPPDDPKTSGPTAP